VPESDVDDHVAVLAFVRLPGGWNEERQFV